MISEQKKQKFINFCKITNIEHLILEKRPFKSMQEIISDIESSGLSIKYVFYTFSWNGNGLSNQFWSNYYLLWCRYETK